MKHTEETKLKISNSRKGIPAWNKGIHKNFISSKNCKSCNKIFYKNKWMNIKRWEDRTFCCTGCSKKKSKIVEYKKCIICNILFQKNMKRTQKEWEERKFCSSKCAIKKAHKQRLGTKLSLEWCKNLSNSHLGQKAWNKGKEYNAVKGKNNPNWKGGISKINRSERQNFMSTLQYKQWRHNVYKRDNYTCQHCKIRGGKLNADHIKPFSLYPELRLDVNNGRTLCIECHMLIGYSLFKENNPRKKFLKGDQL